MSTTYLGINSSWSVSVIRVSRAQSGNHSLVSFLSFLLCQPHQGGFQSCVVAAKQASQEGQGPSREMDPNGGPDERCGGLLLKD